MSADKPHVAIPTAEIEDDEEFLDALRTLAATDTAFGERARNYLDAMGDG